MLKEMCEFIDCYAEHILEKEFDKEWPKNPLLRNRVYINSILGSLAETNAVFVVYEPKSNEVKIVEKNEVREHISEKIWEVIGPFLMNPAVSARFYEENNKWLGSNSGIKSYFPFIFKLPTTKSKIENAKKSLKYYNASEFLDLFNKEVFLETIEKKVPEMLKKREEDLKKEKDALDKKSDMYKDLYKKLRAIPYLLILFEDPLPYENFLRSEKILKNAITISQSNATRKDEKCQVCQVCGSREEVGYPTVGNSYGKKKEFLISPTKGKGRIGICSTCGFKVNAFYKLLEKLSIIPVFIDRSAMEITALEIRDYLKDDEWYPEFMTRIYEELNENDCKMAHYLIIPLKNIIWVDYVSSLKWILEWRSLLFYRDEKKLEIKREDKNRKDIENIFYAAIKKGTDKSKNLPFQLYFEDLKEKDETRKYEAYLLYRYKDYFYRFTYKNEYPFSKSEIIEFVNYAILQKYLDTLSEGWTLSTFEESIIAPLEIFFNIENIVRGEKMKKLEELRKKLDEILEKDAVELDEAEWAYCAGAFYRYLISKSRSKEPPLNLEPLMNAGTTKEVVDILTRTFEKYQHEILQPYLSKWGSISAFAFASIDKGKNFEELKPFFYAGFVDPFALKKFYG